MRLRQAVGNLVSNAVRHTPEGGRVTLRVYVAGRDASGPYAPGPNASEEGRGTAVTGGGTGGDRGVRHRSGIPADDLPHVFDRFWRAEKSRSRRTGGSGLGLAIVRKLVEAHGGTVEATSTEGEGSTFTLRLPGAGGRPAPDGMTTAF